MTPRDYVLANQEIVQQIKDRLPGNEKLDMYFGTLDYATSRFNTILLKLSQDKIKEQEYELEVHDCFEAIQAFYKNVKRYDNSPKIFKFVFAIMLHGIGTRRISKIKKLLSKISN